MDPNKRRLAESWHDQAGIQAAQQCVELSVKATLVFLNIDFPKAHGWDEKQLQIIADLIRRRRIVEKLDEFSLGYSVPLPRLLFLMNFWSEFYLLTKYGMEAGSLATSKDLFRSEEAELAIRHADECAQAAGSLRYLNGEQTNQLLGEKPD